MKKLRSKLFYLMRKYSTFSTVILSTLLIIFGYIISSILSGENLSWELLTKSGWAFIIVLAASLVSLLPYDIFKTKKDSKMCKELGLDYYTFAVLDEVGKDEIREKYAKNA